MFETLTRGFREARDRLRGVTSFSEDNLAEPLREIRMSLLEADVDLTEVRTFLDAVKQPCLGSEVALRTGKRGKRQRVSLSDRFTKACYEELCQLLGADAEEVAPRRGARTLMLLGLQETGKTSSEGTTRIGCARPERPETHTLATRSTSPHSTNHW